MSLLSTVWGVAWRVAAALTVYAGLYVGGCKVHQLIYGLARPDLAWGLSVYLGTWLFVALSLLSGAGRQIPKWPALPLTLSLAAVYLLGLGLLSGAWTGHLPYPWRLLHLAGCGLAGLGAPWLVEHLPLIRRKARVRRP